MRGRTVAPLSRKSTSVGAQKILLVAFFQHTS
jgi:hypothetical protein